MELYKNITDNRMKAIQNLTRFMLRIGDYMCEMIGSNVCIIKLVNSGV